MNATSEKKKKNSECKTSASAPTKYPTDLQQHTPRVVRCCLNIRFLQLQCWTGWDAWSSGPHCRSQTCSQMLHQVAIVFPSSVKTGRSPSSSTPTIVAFVPPGMTSWHDDTTRAQARDPIHGVKPWEATSSNTCARMCQGACEPHSALRLETRVPDKHP